MILLVCTAASAMVASAPPMDAASKGLATAASESSANGNSLDTPSAQDLPAPSPAATGSTIVVLAPPRPTPADPLEHINIKTYEVMQLVDRGVIAPVASGYRHAVPVPLRDGIHNFLGNLDEPIVFINFLGQHKLGKASETFGRFAINSTLGIAGLFDVAKKKPFRLPHRPNGFADTMGFYRIGPGPFFFLPLVGPTTLRDITGGLVDRLVLPLGVGAPFNQPGFTVPAGALKGLDRRLRFDSELHAQRQTSQPYVSAREYYLARRRREVDHLQGRDAVSLAPRGTP